MKSPQAFVVGYYGMSNYGDDLFNDVLRHGASQILPSHRVRVASAPSPRARGPLARMFRRIEASDSVAGSVWRLIHGLILLRARMIILGGGSVLSEMKGVREVQSKLARFTRTRFQAWGVSLGPFPSPRDFESVAAFLRRMDRVIVRDRRSLKVANEMGVVAAMGGDLAALYADQHPRSPRSTSHTHRRIGLALCNTPASPIDVNSLADSLAAAISDSPSHREDLVVVLVLNNHPVHGDEEISVQAADRLKSHGLPVLMIRHSEADVGVIWSAIDELDALVAVRLHAAVSAYLTSVPFLLVEYHPKCSDFLDDVRQDAGLRVPRNAAITDVRTGLSNLLSDPVAPGMPAGDYVARAVRTYTHMRLE